MKASIVLAALAGIAASASAQFGLLGYSENFDSMGTGTALPAGWSMWVGPSGTANNTWTTTIPGTGVAALIATTGPLASVTTPTANQNNGFNAARAASALTDRVVATAPTTVSGSAIQLALTNSTGVTLPAGQNLTISFDIIRYNAATNANELPGYWLFANQTGTTWNNVGPNPTITTVPNTAGIASYALTYALTADWTAGSTIRFRWVDDNAVATSPDQIIGLNNVRVIPTPGAATLMGLGLIAAGRRRR
jgi:hypothetical protein